MAGELWLLCVSRVGKVSAKFRGRYPKGIGSKVVQMCSFRNFGSTIPPWDGMKCKAYVDCVKGRILKCEVESFSKQDQ